MPEYDVKNISIETDEKGKVTVTIPYKPESSSPPPLVLAESKIDKQIASFQTQITRLEAKITKFEALKTKVASLKA